MKQSGTTTAFVIACIAVLLAAYGVGLGIRTVRFGAAEAQAAATTESEKPANELEDKDVVAKSDPEAETPDESEESPAQEEGESPDEERPGPGRMAGMRERFQNMSEEERREAMAQMRERSGGGRRGGGGGFGLSEEDRAKFREEMQELGERAENMSDEEREQARTEIFEKYGIPQRGSGGRRRSGGGGGGDAPPPKGRACFVAQTPVWADGKLVQISKVATGQTVGTRLGGSSLLEQVQEHAGTFECRDIVLASGSTIGVVDAHCFMLDSGQWVAAQNLTSGLRLKTLTGSVSIKSVTKRAVPYTGKVYNLKVKSSDRYMVGKDAIIVRDY